MTSKNIPKHISEAGKLSDQLIEVLSRFSANPRGHLPSRADAEGRAAEACVKYGNGVDGLRAAVSVLRELSRTSNYLEPRPENITDDRRKLQMGKAFVWDIKDDRTPGMLTHVQAKYVRGAGRGNRTDLRKLTAFVQALLEIERCGLPSPAKAILPRHIQIRAFAEALVDARYITEEELADLQTTNASTLQKLRQVRRRAIRMILKAAEEITH